MPNSSGIPVVLYSDLSRIIRCLMEVQRPGEAQDYLSQIKESPPHALTHVLQFQVAVRCDDEELGAPSQK